MKRQKKRLIEPENNYKFRFTIFVVLILIALISFSFFNDQATITGFATFSTNFQSDFDEGIYSGTFYDSEEEGIQLNLSEGFTLGDYTSKVFDAGSDANWDEVSWEGDTPKIPIHLIKGKKPTFQNTYLTLQIRNCSLANCSDEEFSGNYSDSPTTLNLSGRYFQYKFDFLTENISKSPILYNVTIDYNIINIAPTITLNSPENNSELNESYVLLNATFYDFSLDNLTVWFYGNDSLVNTNYNITNGTTLTYNWTNLNNGLYNWTVIANDGNDNSSNKYYYFDVNVSEETNEEETPEEPEESSGRRSGPGRRTTTTEIPEETLELIKEKDQENIVQEENQAEYPKETTPEIEKDNISDFITGFAAFTVGNWTKVNGALAFFMLLILFYIKVIRPKYREEKQPKKRKRKKSL